MRSMVIPALAALTFGGIFDPAGFWHTLSTLFGSLALWAQHRAEPDGDPVQDLTFRLRHPARNAALHPFTSCLRGIRPIMRRTACR